MTLRAINRNSGGRTGHFNSEGNRKSEGKQETLTVRVQETVIAKVIEGVG